MTPNEQGLKLRGQYVKGPLPKFNSDQDYIRFFEGAFWPNLPWMYATNYLVLIEVQEKLIELGYEGSFEIKPYNNMECEFGLYMCNDLYKILTNCNSYCATLNIHSQADHDFVCCPCNRKFSDGN